MQEMQSVAAGDWYETIPFADVVTLIHEPWMPPFFRGHMWLVRGRDRDLLIDAGLGHVPLRDHVPALRGRPVTLLISHTHWDGGHFPSFGRVRFAQVADGYLTETESFQIPA